jgi:uncharacterized protein YbaP (TraB family)
VNLCEKCYDKKTTGKVAGIAEPASKADIRVMLQSATLQIKALRHLPVDQRIAELEKSLTQKVEVAPGMEPAYDA